MKRVISLTAVVAVALYGMTLLPARAGTFSVPADVSIEDPSGDANGINDQGIVPAPTGDRSSELYITSADILRVWFSDTPDDITAHIQTDLPPPNPNYGLTYRVMLNPTADVPGGCLWFEATIPSATWRAPETAALRRNCPLAQDISGEVVLTKLPDTTGVVSITVPRSAAPDAFAAGATLRVAGASSRLALGTVGPDGVVGIKAPQLDNTLPGEEYTVGPSQPEASATPTQSPSDPEKKKCTRKNKPKRCKKRGDGSEPAASPSPTSSADPTAMPSSAPTASPTMQPSAAPIPTPHP